MEMLKKLLSVFLVYFTRKKGVHLKAFNYKTCRLI